MFQDFYCRFLVCLLNVGPKRLTIRWAVLTELGSMFFCDLSVNWSVW